jgi:hypothetical protein
MSINASQAAPAPSAAIRSSQTRRADRGARERSRVAELGRRFWSGGRALLFCENEGLTRPGPHPVFEELRDVNQERLSRVIPGAAQAMA